MSLSRRKSPARVDLAGRVTEMDFVPDGESYQHSHDNSKYPDCRTPETTKELSSFPPSTSASTCSTRTPTSLADNNNASYISDESPQRVNRIIESPQRVNRIIDFQFPLQSVPYGFEVYERSTNTDTRPHCNEVDYGEENQEDSSQLSDLEIRSSYFMDEYEIVANLADELHKEESENTPVFIKHQDYGWLPATVIEARKDMAAVRVEWPDSSDTIIVDDGERQPSTTVTYKEYLDSQLPSRNDETKRDMVDMVHVHEAAILYNLKNQHRELRPYTRVGEILVAVNPFQWIEPLYSSEQQELYVHRILGKTATKQRPTNHTIQSTALASKDTTLLDYTGHFDRLGTEPHIYEMSTLAYRGIVHDGRDQTILVTGDSGAGKTETVKLLLSHLATIPKNSALEIVTRVCQSSPVFEAFGNAKTEKNDNSSRFGKFIQIQFQVEDSQVDMAGSICETYLLEKTRVVYHTHDERSYHIFYQLLAAPEEFKQTLWPFFSSCQSEDFLYLKNSAQIDPLFHSDEKQWVETKEALSHFGFVEDSLSELMRAVAIVLQLGNLVFCYGKEHDELESENAESSISSEDELRKLSIMTGVRSEELQETFTYKVLRTGGEEVRSKVSPQISKEWCDALAKEMYAKIFDVIVRKINGATAFENNDQQKVQQVSLLDIFGFECFDINRFEQLCINYANEKLHNKYVNDNFEAAKAELEAEGIDMYDFSMVDNTGVLDLLESQSGIISLVNETCRLARGSCSGSLVSKIIHSNHLREDFYTERMFGEREFGVKHFAGPVVYNAEQFLERNMDKLPYGVVKCAAMFTNSIVGPEFQTLNPESGPLSRRGSLRKSTLVLEKFQSQLKNLLAALDTSDIQYIRCIKPNAQFLPQKMDHLFTLRQLKHSGLMTAVALTKESYPDRLDHKLVLDRFSCLAQYALKTSKNITVKEKVKVLLADHLKCHEYKCGKTKTFFKSGAKEKLEVQRLEHFDNSATTIQALARRIQAVEEVARRRMAILQIQSIYRMKHCRTEFEKGLRAAVCLVNFGRRVNAIYLVERLQREKNAAVVIQKHARLRLAVKRVAHFKAAIITVQSLWRMWVKLVAFESQKMSATTIASWYRAIVARRRVERMRVEQDAALRIQREFKTMVFRRRQRAVRIIEEAYLSNRDKLRARRPKHTQKGGRNGSDEGSPAGIWKGFFHLVDSIFCCPGTGAVLT